MARYETHRKECSFDECENTGTTSIVTHTYCAEHAVQLLLLNAIYQLDAAPELDFHTDTTGLDDGRKQLFLDAQRQMSEAIDDYYWTRRIKDK